ncbi:hypothetical protein EDB86DRAFT_566983 [Lactarius hatsudake]|nr:hypothetical protein EDB86DRAFT_566983 [Lactarius hatsudake]
MLHTSFHAPIAPIAILCPNSDDTCHMQTDTWFRSPTYKRRLPRHLGRLTHLPHFIPHLLLRASTRESLPFRIYPKFTFCPWPDVVLLVTAKFQLPAVLLDSSLSCPVQFTSFFCTALAARYRSSADFDVSAPADLPFHHLASRPRLVAPRTNTISRFMSSYINFLYLHFHPVSLSAFPQVQSSVGPSSPRSLRSRTFSHSRASLETSERRFSCLSGPLYKVTFTAEARTTGNPRAARVVWAVAQRAEASQLVGVIAGYSYM